MVFWFFPFFHIRISSIIFFSFVFFFLLGILFICFFASNIWQLVVVVVLLVKCAKLNANICAVCVCVFFILLFSISIFIQLSGIYFQYCKILLYICITEFGIYFSFCFTHTPKMYSTIKFNYCFGLLFPFCNNVPLFTLRPTAKWGQNRKRQLIFT